MDRRLMNFEMLKLSMCYETTLASDTLIDFQINFPFNRFNTTAGNPVKEILLKLNLPDHRSILTDSKDFFQINELQDQLEAKNVSTKKLKKHIANLKGKNVVENVEIVNNSNVVTQEHTATLWDIAEQARALKSLDNALDFSCQFCDSDLEVAFWKHTCYVRNLEGADLLFRSRDTNLYTISLDDMLKSSPICLLSKASKTKSWLWNRRLSHLNFGTLNQLAKQGLVRQSNLKGLVSNFMVSQDARLSKFEADFKQQQGGMTIKIDAVLKAINDRIMGTLPSDTVKNPKLSVNSTSSVFSARSYPMEDS
ncbi:integrase, catalytic region, zinc finger, CCHC-type containing protein [Tanacetum coccineum]